MMRLLSFACSILLVSQLAFSGLSPSPLLRAEEPGEPTPPQRPTPWDYASEPRAATPAWYDNFLNRARPLDAEEIGRWMVPLPGQAWKVEEASNRYGQQVSLAGNARLVAPWRADAVLRLGMAPTEGTTIHFWNGHQGVSLRFQRSSYRRHWVAFRTTHAPGQPLLIDGVPHQVSAGRRETLANDRRRDWRLHAGAYHFRHQQGLLRMTLGDAELLAAPLDGPPTEVTFEWAETPLHDIGLYRGADWPAVEEVQHPAILAASAPAKLPWRLPTVAGARWIQHPEGSVELQARDTQQPAMATFPLRQPGLVEVLWRIERPQAGVGVCLADESGRPVAAAGFLREERLGRPVVAYEKIGTPRFETSIHPDIALPLASESQWLRAVIGGGLFRVWLSADGEHWAQLDLPVSAADTSFSSVGLFAHEGPGRRSIRLAELRVRELSGLTQLAPLADRQRANRVVHSLGLTQAGDLGEWLARVAAGQPEDVATRAWRRACALATLTAGPPPALGNALLQALIDEALPELDSPTAALAMLDDAALLLNTQTPEITAALAARYDKLGALWIGRGRLDAGAHAAGRLKVAPIWNHYNSVYRNLPLEARRVSLLAAVANDDWTQVRDVCQQIHSENWAGPLSSTWQANALPLRLTVDWAAASAALQLPRETGDGEALLRSNWRHPLIEQLSKEAYNTLAEVEVALNSEAYLDACRIIADASGREVGLLPDRQDRRLFVSLPTSVTLAMRQYPALRETMSDQFAPQGMLRVRRAMGEDDVATVAAATVQFHGTAAAAEAHRWLGDRQLSSGKFHQALANYGRALRTAPFAERVGIEARRRLAAAMLGQARGEPLQRPIEFGETILTPEQFEKLIGEMLAKHNPQALDEPADAASPSTDPFTPARREASLFARFEGQLGAGSGAAQAGVNWPARQLALVPAGDLLLAANRFQVVAYAADSGQTRWTYGLGGNQGGAAAQPLVAMRPAVTADQVVTRLLPRDGRPQLVSIARATGQLTWSTSGLFVASDPIVVEDRIFIVAIDTLETDLVTQMVLMQLDPLTGGVLERWPLLEVNDNWQQYGNCQATLAGDRIVIATAGCVLATDFSGVVAWLRRCNWVPVDVDAGLPTPWHVPPVVDDDRIYVAQPGVRYVDCLDAMTGRLHWRAPLPNLLRVVGLANDLLLVETLQGLTALELEQGNVRWYHAQPELRDVLCAPDAQHALLLVREPTGAGTYSPTLVWLDVKSRRPLARWPLLPLADGQTDAGPLWRVGNRLFCGRSPWDPSNHRRQGNFELFQLAADPAAAPPEAGQAADQGLLPARDEQLQTAVRRVLPAWELVSAASDDGPALLAESLDEPPALITQATAATPVRLLLRVAVPADGNARLRLACAAASGRQAAVVVSAAGRPLRQLTPTPIDGPNPWQPVEIDLSPLAGRTVSLLLLGRPLTSEPVRLHWRLAEVVTGG